ncbi:hypothetical protein [Paenibacillus sp. NEAU-GSW1]|uniref:hypothetical protein n=1 Tax=Paenibacillus sp. NEAU-GSW1 TaxID=2682486 RepID=UPI0012E2A932|nr:hypothetical protein [Paenibacillus sp. NEAU-GSW1]MUT66811.1 hypothetical protein [Paenibacillus sp. NEAU-GSW1]
MNNKKATVKRCSAKKPVSRKLVNKKSVCSTAKKSVCRQTVIKKRICKTTIVKKRVFKKALCKPTAKTRSAFRAVSGMNQQLPDSELTQVDYQVQELDLNNEYNPATSTFRPKKSGVYALFASVFFTSTTVTNFSLNLQIRVNGVPRITDQEDYFNTGGIIDAGGIIDLEARDIVEVFATAIDKNLTALSGINTRFEGARIS